MSSVVVDAVEHLVRGIVDNPDDVRVDMVTNRRGRTLEVRVHPDDLGKVIGRSGRTATALRTLARAWTDSGGTLIGLAPTAAAAAVLREELDTTTDTAAKLVQLATAERELAQTRAQAASSQARCTSTKTCTLSRYQR